jgi:hypothetical protein
MEDHVLLFVCTFLCCRPWTASSSAQSSAQQRQHILMCGQQQGIRYTAATAHPEMPTAALPASAVMVLVPHILVSVVSRQPAMLSVSE